jgi:hypothetical protein
MAPLPLLLWIVSSCFLLTPADATLGPTIKAWQEVKKRTTSLQIDFSVAESSDDGKKQFTGSFYLLTQRSGVMAILEFSDKGEKKPFESFLMTSEAFYVLDPLNATAVRFKKEANRRFVLKDACAFLEGFVGPLWEVLEDPKTRDDFHITLESEDASRVHVSIKEKKKRPYGMWPNPEACVVRLVKKGTNGIPAYFPSKLHISWPYSHFDIEITNVTFGRDAKPGGLDIPERRPGWKVVTFDYGDE